MHRNIFPHEERPENPNLAFHPSTSNMLTQQPLMTSITVNPSILEYSITSNILCEMGRSANLTLQNEIQYADVSNGRKFDAASEACWTAELPVVQRQYGFDVEQNTLMAVTQTDQSGPNLSKQPDLFDNQEWLYNNTPLSDCQGQHQDSMSWDQSELGNTQGYDSCSSNELPNPSLSSLLTEANMPVREGSLVTSTPGRFSTGAETPLEILTTNLPGEDGTGRPIAIDGDGLLMKLPADLNDVNLAFQTGQHDSPDSPESKITPSPTDSSTFGSRMLGVTRRARSGLMYMIKRDSGYASGRNSPLTLSSEDTRPDPSSLLEFKGLYRVPCQRLHEPPPIVTFYIPQSKIMERFKETQTCPQCQYSSIHNLSWSARYLGLAVFKAELKLDTKYQIAALDKAGNSALHYAASGGAGYEHFAALIHAGVDPYQINTAGQLFLHCLRPYIREIGSEGFDDKLVTGFHTDLVDLLNKFQPKGAFRWRDNEGCTVLDAIASNISNATLRDRTLR